VDPDADALNEVVMAVDIRGRNGTVGCAYYVARGEKLCFMEDVKLGGVDVVDALKSYIDLTVILVSTRADDTLIDRLDPEARGRGDEDGTCECIALRTVPKVLTPGSLQADQFRLPYNLEVRPSSEFSYEAAKNKLVNLRIGSDVGPQVTFVVPGDVLATDEYEEDGEGGFSGRQGRLLRLSCWIDVESRLTVSNISQLPQLV